MLSTSASATISGTAAADDTFFPARKVLERYNVSDMTLHRWVRDPRMGFPAPVYFGRFRFWKISELEAWERAQPRGTAA